MGNNLQRENEMLKRQLECLEGDYRDELQVTTDYMIMQEDFMNYLKSKLKEDKINKKIYEEIIKRFEGIMI